MMPARRRIAHFILGMCLNLKPPLWLNWNTICTGGMFTEHGDSNIINYSIDLYCSESFCALSESLKPHLSQYKRENKPFMLRIKTIIDAENIDFSS